MDHPALVVIESTAHRAIAELRGGVLAPYLERAVVELAENPRTIGRIEEMTGNLATVSWRGSGLVIPGAILRWRFPPASLGIKEGRLRARACDDLAGVAAALTALVRAREANESHFSVLLTRAEEVGFVGALAACDLGTLSNDTQVLSIECSRELPEAPVGGGPVVRVGDGSSVFSSGLTNRVAEVAKRRKVPHQRRLMGGGSCEATVFAAMGWEATGLCLALGNYHNMVRIDEVLANKRRARLAPEEIDVNDFHGLVDLLFALAADLNSTGSDLPGKLKHLYKTERHVLDTPPTTRNA
jgi:endoglucanase